MAESTGEFPYKKQVERLENLIRNSRGTKESEIPNPQARIVVIGATYFPGFDGKYNDDSDNVRGLSALQTLEKLNIKGIDVCLVDGGSSKAFTQMVERVNPRRFFSTKINRKAATLIDFNNLLEVENESREKGEKMPGVILLLNQKEKGYSQARVEAIKSVTDVVTGLVNHGVIIQMEIEKTELVREIGKIASLITEGEADIVIPDRGIRVKELGDEYDNFCNYPKFQAVSERKANLLIHQMLVEAGLRKSEDPVLDFFGGTRAFKDDPDLRSLFGITFKIPQNSPFWGKIKPEAYSNAVYFPIYIALALKKKVASVPIDFSYPAQQSRLEEKDEDFAAKRQRQFDDIVSGSRLLIDFLGKKLRAVGLAGKIVDQRTVLKILREGAVIDLRGMEWTGKNEFAEEKYYRQPNIPLILERVIDRNHLVEYLDEALSSYVSNFDPQHSFLEWDEFQRVKKTINLLKRGVGLFGKDKEAQKVYEKYRMTILNNLFNATLAFYGYGDSDASRNLDIASFFAHSVEVPKEHYIVAVLLGTPNSNMVRELASLSKEYSITEEERRWIIKNVMNIIVAKTPVENRKEVLSDLAGIFQLSPEDVAEVKKHLKLK